MFTVVVTHVSSLRPMRLERELLVDAVDTANDAVMNGAESVVIEDERGRIAEAVTFEDLAPATSRGVHHEQDEEEKEGEAER